MSLTDKKEVTASLTYHITDKFKVIARCPAVQDTIGINARVSTDTLIAEEVYQHTLAKDNPHSVTAKQIGAKEKTFVHRQMSPSKEWEIEHNLFEYPSVSVVDSAGSVVIGDVTYISDSKLLIKFNAAFAGKAYLN